MFLRFVHCIFFKRFWRCGIFCFSFYHHVCLLCLPVSNLSLTLQRPHSWLITGFGTRLTRRVPLVEQELLTLREHLSSSPTFSGVRVTRSLVLYVCFICRSLFVLLYFFFWPLCYLFFFDIRILITPLVYSNSTSEQIENQAYICIYCQ